MGKQDGRTGNTCEGYGRGAELSQESDAGKSEDILIAMGVWILFDGYGDFNQVG